MRHDTPQPRRRQRYRALAALAATAGLMSALLTPVTADTATAAGKADGPISVAYVEVNDTDLSVIGDYKLANSGAPLFDIGVIFAANINYDGQRAYLHLNDRVTETLESADTQIRPLQAQGTQVLLSVLGNHQGAGFANFPDQASADAFAQQLADVVAKYDLDGIDFDDEYADYGANGTGPVNDSSFVHLVTALRAKMPADKLITLYDFGPAATKTSYNGVNLGDTFDYAWNAIYGTWSPPALPGMSNAQLSPAAVKFGDTSQATAVDLAQRTKNGGYGVYLTYNLPDQNSASYASAFTNVLYGESTVYTG